MKFIIIGFMILYLYTLSFGIFMTEIFRIPAPLIFCFPLIFLYKNKQETRFLYFKEVALITIAIFLYYIVGLSEFKTFAKNMLTVLICASFFNYYVGNNKGRYNSSLIIFYILLTLSAIVMVFDHFYLLGNFRSALMNEKVMQSPAGIAIFQFTFGYQLAALTPFLFIYTCIYNKYFVVKILVLGICLGFLLLGMQRSAFVAFVICSSLFLILYYRFKAIILISAAAFICVLAYTLFIHESLDGISNIISKNERSNPSYNRSTFTTENIKILLSHPYGLIFYGKTWGDVIYRNYIFSEGTTSHNAYLMFITYLGPFLGLGLLFSIYHKIIAVMFSVVQEIRKKENSKLICLCFSFLAISMNSFFHNGWLIEGNGPTVFLFFSILHTYRFQLTDSGIYEQQEKTLEYA